MGNDILFRDGSCDLAVPWPPNAQKGGQKGGSYGRAVRQRRSRGRDSVPWRVVLGLIFGAVFVLQAVVAAENPPDSSGDKDSEAQASAQEEARAEAERKDREIRQIISYGIDSDLVSAIQTLEREALRLPREADDEIIWIEETPYNQAIYERIAKGYSGSELQTKAIRFFMQQKWLGAKDYAEDIIVRGATEENIDANLLLAALSYVRNLALQGSEDNVSELLSSENPLIAQQAMITLGKIGSSKSGAKLLELLEGEGNSLSEFNEREREVLRTAAITVLGDLVYIDGAAYLFKILEDANNAEYSNAEWGAAAKALGQMNKTAAVGMILQQFRNGNSQERYQAVMALSSFAPQPEFEAVVLQGFQEAYWKTREEAAKAAGRLNLQSAIPSLMYKVAKDSVASVRLAAIQALRHLGAAGSSALKELVQDPDVGETQRLAVLQALIKAQDQSAVEIFRQLLDDSENKFKISRAGIFRIAASEPWSALDFVYTEMLAHRDRRTRQQALHSIARARIKNLQGQVEDLAENSPDSALRQSAKATLTTLDS